VPWWALVKSFLQAFLPVCGGSITLCSLFTFVLSYDPIASGRIERYVNSRRFTLPPTREEFHNPPLARRLVLNIVREFNGSPQQPCAGSGERCLRPMDFPASAAFDVLQRGRPICQSQLRRTRTTDQPNSAICGEPGKKALVARKIRELCRHFSGVLCVRSNELWDMSVEGIR
jgi:hypothetical protein